jgi:hypothetical protein
MTAPRTLPLLLALTLLLAQQAAFAHALSHLDPGTQSKEGLVHTTLCAKCSTLGQLSSVVPTSATVDLDQSASAVQIGAADHSVARRAVTAFRSRAPPYLS